MSLVMSNKTFILTETHTAQIPPLADQITQWLRQQKVADSVIRNINLCLDELLTNTLSYGFDASHKTPRINIELSLNPDWLEVEIIDNAIPFNPIKEVDPPDLDASIEERRVGGLGVHFVKTLTDAVTYRLDKELRNHLIFRKYLN